MQDGCEWRMVVSGGSGWVEDGSEWRMGVSGGWR